MFARYSIYNMLPPNIVKCCQSYTGSLFKYILFIIYYIFLAGCFLYRTWEALLIGSIGGGIACLAMPLFDRIGVDDPVGASSVHGVAGLWGMPFVTPYGV